MKLNILTLLFGLIVLVSSCNRKKENVFFDSQGTLGYDGFSYTDTLALITRTVREDSLKTDSLSHNLIGAINDPFFGNYAASSFFQFSLPQLNKVISTERLDSVVLMMQYTSSIAYYGDLQSSVSLNVYELNEPMGSSVTHSNQAYNYFPNVIGTFNGRFNPKDTTTIRFGNKFISVPATLKIRLSNDMATKLFNANSSDLSTKDNFKNFFKGIIVKPSTTNGSIAAFNMLGAHSMIRIYYNDSMNSDFVVEKESERFTQFEISNQPTAITKQKSASVTSNFDTCFVQSMSGAKMQIRFPNLFSLIKDPSKKISIAKAELFIRPIIGSNSNNFSLPVRLLCLQPHPTNNTNAGILDLSEFFYGGSYNSQSNHYKFFITRHIQSLFSDFQNKGINNNRGLFITIPNDFPIAPSRLLVDARKNMPNAGIELKIYYTEL
ncbi:MAG: DUF4270 family protein [Bacteroidota bacterium]|nr:DUF4270 family protein [Bacteroidota bacterium]